MSKQKTFFDEIFEIAVKSFKESLSKPPTPPAGPSQRNEDARLRSRHEVQLNRLLGDTRRALHKEQESSERALLALNVAFQRAYERWPEMPGALTQTPEAYQGKTLSDAVNYAVYLIGLVGPKTEAERQPTTEHVFDSDGSRTREEAQAIIQELTDQQRSDERTIIEQARQIETLRQNLERAASSLDERKSERRIDPDQSHTWTLLNVSKGRQYDVEVIAHNGAKTKIPLASWLKWSKT